jgi:hypothetical protein
MDSDAGGYYPPDAGGHLILPFILLLLILFVIGGGGGWAGHYTASRGHESRRAAARRAIFKAVRRAIDKALKARDAELAIAARDLMKVTAQRLGPLADAGRPVFSAMDAVNKALAGKIMDTPKVPPPPPPKPPAPAEEKTTESASGGTVLYKPSLNFNFGGANESERKPDPPPAPPPKPVERDMTVPEQRAELTKAIEAFDRAWQADKVEAFLAAAQAALLDVDGPDDHADDDHGRGQFRLF